MTFPLYSSFFFVPSSLFLPLPHSCAVLLAVGISTDSAEVNSLSSRVFVSWVTWSRDHGALPDLCGFLTTTNSLTVVLGNLRSDTLAVAKDMADGVVRLFEAGGVAREFVAQSIWPQLREMIADEHDETAR
jgi:hypothetical protein